MRIKPIFILFGILFSTVTSADSANWQDRLDNETTPLVFDASLFGVDQATLKKAAIVAMQRRKWKFESIEDTLVIGKYASAKVMINFESAEKITIGYLKQFDAQDLQWLRNLKKDMLYEAARCSNFGQ